MTVDVTDTAAANLLPGPIARIIDQKPDTRTGDAPDTGEARDIDTLIRLHHAMVIGRAVEAAATALALQGMLSAFPAARGQEASQVGAVSALTATDWLFPTYRDTIAVLTRGIPAADVLAGPLGYRHCGYDPRHARTAPMCTPLATHAPHAAGLAHAARLQGQDTVALALLGDGATSEGDFHAGLNFAAVFQAPVVFVIQNNQYAISTPVGRQTRAPSLAHKGIGYGIPGVIVDGNDVLAVRQTVQTAVDRARAGDGPTLIEALTYRLSPHTTSDDPARYRDSGESISWAANDPITRYATYLTGQVGVSAARLDTAQQAAADIVTALRQALTAGVAAEADLTLHVLETVPATLRAQADVAHRDASDA